MALLKSVIFVCVQCKEEKLELKTPFDLNICEECVVSNYEKGKKEHLDALSKLYFEDRLRLLEGDVYDKKYKNL